MSSVGWWSRWHSWWKLGGRVQSKSFQYIPTLSTYTSTPTIIMGSIDFKRVSADWNVDGIVSCVFLWRVWADSGTQGYTCRWYLHQYRYKQQGQECQVCHQEWSLAFWQPCWLGEAAINCGALWSGGDPVSTSVLYLIQIQTYKHIMYNTNLILINKDGR